MGWILRGLVLVFALEAAVLLELAGDWPTTASGWALFLGLGPFLVVGVELASERLARKARAPGGLAIELPGDRRRSTVRAYLGVGVSLVVLGLLVVGGVWNVRHESAHWPLRSTPLPFSVIEARFLPEVAVAALAIFVVAYLPLRLVRAPAWGYFLAACIALAIPSVLLLWLVPGLV